MSLNSKIYHVKIFFVEETKVQMDIIESQKIGLDSFNLELYLIKKYIDWEPRDTHTHKALRSSMLHTHTHTHKTSQHQTSLCISLPTAEQRL